MASIDLDPVSLKQTLANLRGMNSSNRLHALLYGFENPEHNLEAPSNAVLGGEDKSLIAAGARVVLKPEPEPKYQPVLP